MSPRRGRFAPPGISALERKAWGLFFDMAAPPQVERRGDVAILGVRGPLMHHEDWCFDSYDSIKARVLACIAEKPAAIVLSIDSPGGLVSGCFDTADEIRDACAAASVPLYAHVDGQACSAAYALACAASRIAIPETGTVGSVGCIAEIVSFAAMDKAFGLDRRVITSGDRKADGSPSVPITDDAEKAIHEQVLQLAETFFEHVAASRPMQVDEVRALQAGVVIGARAVPSLADDVMSLDQMIAAIAAGEFAAADADARKKGSDMKIKSGAASTKAEGEEEKNPFATAREALQAAADGDDEKEAAKAKKALAAMDEGDETEADHPETDDAEDDKKDKDTKALAARLDRLERDQKARDAKAAKDAKDAEDGERAELLATRTDLDEATKALLATAPIAQVRAFVKAAPKRTPKAAATAVVPSTRGAASGTTTTSTEQPTMQQDPTAARAMAARMGTVKQASTVVDEGASLVIGVLAPVD